MYHAGAYANWPLQLITFAIAYVLTASPLFHRKAASLAAASACLDPAFPFLVAPLSFLVAPLSFLEVLAGHHCLLFG